MHPLTVALAAFAIIFGGALAGVTLGRWLPERHLDDGTKDVIRLGTGVIGTIAALVLGLLIASAKSAYDRQGEHVTRIAADIILLDRILAQYGPEATPVRRLLRLGVGQLIERVWQENRSNAVEHSPFETSVAAEQTLMKIQELSPQGEAQRLLKDRAIQVGFDLAQTRLQLFEQGGSAIPMPFLAVLVFWLALIFGSFGIFSTFNPTLITALGIFAFSASAAVFLILELSEPFGGMLELPSAPLRNTLLPL